jgi:hypothetical protein
VGYNQHGFPESPRHVIQKSQNILPCRGVQGTGGFIAEEEFGIFDDGSGYRRALQFSAGQFRREMVFSVFQADGAQDDFWIEGVMAYPGGDFYVFVCV